MRKDKPFSIADDGQPIFAGLVKPLKSGDGVSVTVFVSEEDDGLCKHAEWKGELAILLATALEEVVGHYGR